MRTVLLVGGVCLALVVGGFVAWRLMRSESGASTPEAAVEAFLQAGASQDVVKMLGTINPAEVRGFKEAYDALRERAEDEDMTSGAGITDAFDLQLSDLEFEVREQTDDFAVVTLEGGTYDLRYDPDGVPSRFAEVAREHPDALHWSGDLLEQDDYGEPYWLGTPVLWYSPDDPYRVEEPDWDTLRPALDVVRVDGRWYVSTIRSFATQTYSPSFYRSGLRGNWTHDGREADWEAASDAPDPIVGETPEDVINNLVAALDDQDPAQVLANFDADEVMALRPFVGYIERELRDADPDTGFSVDDIELETEERGDVTIVTLNRGTLTVEDNGDYGLLEYSNGCIYEDGYEEGCLRDGEAHWIDDPFVVMIKTNGGYQLSLSATAAEYATQFATNISGSLLDDIAEELCWEAGTDC
jgi:hypothetical protein